MNRRTALGPVSRRAVLSAAAAAIASAQQPRSEVRLPRKVRIAIIGFDGHPGEITGVLSRLPDVEVAAISDKPAAMARAARNPRFAGAKQFTDYERMLDGEKVDVVAVCNNNGERAGAVIASAKRGLNVIAEKPLAIVTSDLERVKQAVSASGIHLGMLLPMRYSPSYLALKQIVDSGEIGEIALISAQKSYKAGSRPEWMLHPETYGGTIPWIGIHMVDLMRWTSGREFTATASFQGIVGSPGNKAMENTTASIFQLDNGGTATLRMDYFRPESAPTHGDDRLRLAGTKGVAEYMGATGVTVVTDKAKSRVISDLPPGGSVFIDYLLSVYAGKEPTLTLKDIYRTNEIVLAARDAADQRTILKL